MSEQILVVKKQDGSAARLAAIRSTLKRGFQEPIEEVIPEGQMSMMAQLFPVFDFDDDEVKS
jgi:hypothetical protein